MLSNSTKVTVSWYLSRPHIREAVLSKTHGKCAYCGTDVSQRFSCDHVVPQALGGETEIANLLPCCSSCNSIKGSSSVETLRTRLARRLYNVPKFTPEQATWLQRRHGIDVSPPHYVFWYEKYTQAQLELTDI